MKVNLKDILKIAISLVLTALVIWITTKELEWDKLTKALQEYQYIWMALSLLLSIISHILRAYRWRLMLQAGNHNPSLLTSYLALMTGYLANMAIPRLGEVMRCTELNTHEDIPVSYSFGTVITDRLLDLLMLALLSGFLLLMQFDLLGDYFVNYVHDKIPFLQSWWPLLILLMLGGFVVIIWLLKKASKSEAPNSSLSKLGNFVKQMINGIKAVKNVKQQTQFWLSTLGIWVLYFLMLYLISFGFAPTDDLSPMAGVAVLVMGSLGMATPVNNGIGAYQALVGSILVLYGIQYEDGYIFAVLSHGSQVVAVVVIGFISLMILNFKKRRKRVVAEQ